MTIWLSRPVLGKIQKLGIRYYPVETGGVLLGWRDGADRIVTGLLGSGPKALHGRHAFLPDHAWQMIHIREAFEGSSGDLDYLGDWHTHPDGVASMSDLDCRTLSKIARRVKSPLMMIAAGGGSTWTINGWLGSRSSFWRRLSPNLETIRLLDPPEAWPSYFEDSEQ
ncbi:MULTISPECIES: Mov34/MPN/PAD-1 family protein [unclassified Mesorhizobium]|uniref:Mov34/MPN/PAD-1 family protein n=1 Tax=unclassified Mesorhizobium TaxID=325217 RepID=UPI0015CB5A42|nr:MULTISPECIES: Mov34/MPN/PAD-1 family protein [unclassified Mesorhizobium]